MLGIFADFGHVGKVAHHRDVRILVRADTGAIHLECIDFARGVVRQLDWLIVASPTESSNSGRTYHTLSAATPKLASSKFQDLHNRAIHSFPETGQPRYFQSQLSINMQLQTFDFDIESHPTRSQSPLRTNFNSRPQKPRLSSSFRKIGQPDTPPARANVYFPKS